jgi:hypothetical protein
VRLRPEEVILHYLDGRVSLELELPLAASGSPGEAAELARELTRVSREIEEIGDVKVRFRSRAPGGGGDELV